MVRTYRNETAFESGAARFFGSGFFLLLVLTALLIVVFSRLDRVETQFDWFSAPVMLVGVGLAIAWHNRHECREIRLSDDGICEFETRRRSTRLHVNEIRSVTRKH